MPGAASVPERTPISILDYDLMALNEAIKDYQENPSSPDHLTKLIDELLILGQHVNKHFKKVSDTDNVLKIYEMFLQKTFVNRKLIGSAQLQPLEALIDKNLPAKEQDRQAMAFRFYKHLRFIAATNVFAKELQAHQAALEQAIESFIQEPDNDQHQTKLSSKLALFHGYALDQERQRLEAEGKSGVLNTDQRTDVLYAAFRSLRVSEKLFNNVYIKYLSGVEGSILHGMTVETEFAKQQVAAVLFFNGYVTQEIIKRQQSNNYFLSTLFGLLTLISLGAGVLLLAPVWLHSFVMGIGLTQPLVIGLAALLITLSAVTLLACSIAFYSAKHSLSFAAGTQSLRKLVSSTFFPAKPILTPSSAGRRQFSPSRAANNYGSTASTQRVPRAEPAAAPSQPSAAASHAGDTSFPPAPSCR